MALTASQRGVLHAPSIVSAVRSAEFEVRRRFKQSMTDARLVTFRFPRYWEERSEDVLSAGALLRRLAEVQAGYSPRQGEHPAAIVERGDGSWVLVGLAGERWHIEWYEDADGGECLVAVGDGKATGLTPFVIPEWTEVENRYLIPRKVAESVLGEWFESGKLSPCVEWSR